METLFLFKIDIKNYSNRLEMEINKLLKLNNKSGFTKVIDDFVHYFSHLDSKGLASVLEDGVNYDELSKQNWIELFEKQFQSLKKNNIHYLKPINGICKGCKKNCLGFTFLNDLHGFYFDFVFETDGIKIFDFTECFNLKNEDFKLNKKDQIFINDANLFDENLPF